MAIEKESHSLPSLLSSRLFSNVVPPLAPFVVSLITDGRKPPPEAVPDTLAKNMFS